MRGLRTRELELNFVHFLQVQGTKVEAPIEFSALSLPSLQVGRLCGNLL
jgi:hypothetical protein